MLRLIVSRFIRRNQDAIGPWWTLEKERHPTRAIASQRGYVVAKLGRMVIWKTRENWLDFPQNQRGATLPRRVVAEYRLAMRNDKLSTLAAMAALLVAILACKGKAPQGKATVLCEGTKDSIDCEVTHVEGTVAINTCWDLQFDCANGTVVTGSNFCQTVQPGGKVTKKIPLTDLTNAAKCDKATATQVKNLKLTPA